jgi:2-C-methyl-D-erythritol 4-phosphate cytidylyltransferase
VAHAVAQVAAAGADPIIVVGPADALVDIVEALPDVDAEVTVVVGGERRADSVRAGLLHVPDGVDLVAVHDAARGLAPPAWWSEPSRQWRVTWSRPRPRCRSPTR